MLTHLSLSLGRKFSSSKSCRHALRRPPHLPEPNTKTIPLTISIPSLFARRSPSPSFSLLPPRHSTGSIIWCAPNSCTYILLSSTFSVTSIVSSSIQSLLETLSDYIETHIAQAGDGVLTTGEIEFYADNGVEFHSWNTNNHQQTYGVLGAAVEALRDFMGERGIVGASWWVYDAGTEVGAGTIG